MIIWFGRENPVIMLNKVWGKISFMKIILSIIFKHSIIKMYFYNMKVFMRNLWYKVPYCSIMLNFLSVFIFYSICFTEVNNGISARLKSELQLFNGVGTSCFVSV